MVRLTLDSLPFQKFGALVRHHLHHRRLFFSACEVVTDATRDVVLTGTECYSLIGPQNKIASVIPPSCGRLFITLCFEMVMTLCWEERFDGLLEGKKAFKAEFDYFKPGGDGFVKVDIEEK